MAKRDRNDLLQDAHERATNNINPYHWFNKIDSVQLTGWRASLATGVIDLVLASIALVFVAAAHFSEPTGVSFVLSIVLLAFWLISLWRTMRWRALRKSQLEVNYKPKEKKKRHPKRPKNYGRD